MSTTIEMNNESNDSIFDEAQRQASSTEENPMELAMQMADPRERLVDLEDGTREEVEKQMILKHPRDSRRVVSELLGIDYSDELLDQLDERYSYCKDNGHSEMANKLDEYRSEYKLHLEFLKGDNFEQIKIPDELNKKSKFEKKKFEPRENFNNDILYLAWCDECHQILNVNGYKMFSKLCKPNGVEEYTCYYSASTDAVSIDVCQCCFDKKH